jgi:hypothetical protein
MRYIVLALFLVGCGEAGGTNYDVRIGALNPAQCTGYMHLDDSAGYWRCEFIGGGATLNTATPGIAFLDLETTPGAFSRVRGDYSTAGITGQIFIDGDAVAFFATRQAQ